MTARHTPADLAWIRLCNSMAASMRDCSIAAGVVDGDDWDEGVDVAPAPGVPARAGARNPTKLINPAAKMFASGLTGHR
jgi:hypothetical protein